MPCPRRQDLLLCSSLSACPLLHRLLVPLSPENPPSSVDVRSLSPSDGADRLTFPGGGRLVFAGHAAAARHLAAAKEVSARLEALAPWPSPWRACRFALNLPARTNPRSRPLLLTCAWLGGDVPAAPHAAACVPASQAERLTSLAARAAAEGERGRPLHHDGALGRPGWVTASRTSLAAPHTHTHPHPQFHHTAGPGCCAVRPRT